MFRIGRDGIQIDVLNGAEVERQLLRMASEDIPRATAAAIRYTAQGAPPAVSRVMRAEYNINAARVKQGVIVPRVGPMDQGAQVRLNRRPVTLMQFGAKQLTGKGSKRSRGVASRTFRGRRDVNPQGFIGKGKQGAQLPFIRASKARKDLQVLYGPSIHGAFTGGANADAMKQQVAEQLLQRLEVGIRRGIRQFGR